MSIIEGESVTLYERVQVGRDAFHAPIYEETPVEISNVLICPAGAEAVVDGQGMEGRRAEYELLIPKGDTHIWDNCRVDFWDRSWRVFGPILEYIERLTPLDWNRRVKVERYE